MLQLLGRHVMIVHHVLLNRVTHVTHIGLHWRVHLGHDTVLVKTWLNVRIAGLAHGLIVVVHRGTFSVVIEGFVFIWNEIVTREAVKDGVDCVDFILEALLFVGS